MEATDVLTALGNEYNPQILRAAHQPRSAKEFSEDLEVPIATCYRRIEELTETELLAHHDRILTDGQRRTSVYRRSFDVIQIEFEGEDVTIDLQERSPVQNKLDNVWKDLADT